MLSMAFCSNISRDNEFAQNVICFTYSLSGMTVALNVVKNTQHLRRGKVVKDCCLEYFHQGESVCPVCHSQQEASRAERQKAAEAGILAETLSTNAAQLIARRAFSPGDAGLHTGSLSHLALKNPCRRAVFHMLGIYLPEREARAVLQNIHEYKWIEAEKAGYDVWTQVAPREPFLAAARVWAAAYLSRFLDRRCLSTC